MDNTDIQQKNDKVFIAIGVVGVVIVVVFYLFSFSQNPYKKTDDVVIPIVIKHSTPTSTAYNNMFLSARAAVVWDVQNRRFIYEKNGDEVLPLASLTKLMTALAATELLPEHSMIRIAREYLAGLNDSQLKADDNWNTSDLIAHTLITSSNAGANVIASVAGEFVQNNKKIDPRDSFVGYMNKRAQDLGLGSVSFFNDSGLDLNAERSGAYGDAKDMAVLMDFIMQNHPEILEPTTHSKLQVTSEKGGTQIIKNTNTSVERVPGVLASKTGYTDLAGGNLILAFSPGLEGPYIAVVIGSTYEGRFSDMQQLVDATIRMLGDK